MSKSSNQGTLRGDINFIIRLNKIRAEKEMKEGIRISIPDLTKEIINCRAFNELERELLEKRIEGRIRIKYDKRRLW